MGLENFQRALGILAPPKEPLSSMPFLDVQQPHTPTRIIRALLISTWEQLDLCSLKLGCRSSTSVVCCSSSCTVPRESSDLCRPPPCAPSTHAAVVEHTGSPDPPQGPRSPLRSSTPSTAGLGNARGWCTSPLTAAEPDVLLSSHSYCTSIQGPLRGLSPALKPTWTTLRTYYCK